MKIVEHLEKERERERLKLTGGGPKVIHHHRAKLGQGIYFLLCHFSTDVGWF